MSILELIVVMFLMALLTAIVVPQVTERVRLARLRTSVHQFALDLRGARWTAVSGRLPVDMTVSADPDNAYEYIDTHGRLRRIEMPDGVRIVSSTSPIRFKANGSVEGGAVTVIETYLSEDSRSRWTVETNVLGVPTTTQEQIGL